MPEPTAWSPYRPGQGTYARTAAALSLVVVALFGCVRLYQRILPEALEQASKFDFIGLEIPYAVIWPAALFVVLGALIFLFTFGVTTGIKGLDAKAHGLIDILIDTEAELAKVTWPTPQMLTRSTVAVVVTIILLGAFLLTADMAFSWVMSILKIIPE